MADKNEKKQLSGSEATARVRELLGKFRSVMLTTIESRQCLTRPMGLMGKAEHFSGALWFFTDTKSRKADQIRRGATTFLVLQNDEEDTYLQLNGEATIDTDRDRMAQLYTPLLRTWFPDGLEDPNLTLIRFDASDGQYWTSKAGMLEVFAAFAKSVVTGRPGQGGEMGEVELR
jgi:general stress protein 26